MTENPDGGLDRPRTDQEEVFLAALLAGRPWLDVWLQEDEDGTPWLLVSHDFSENNAILATLRLDFDQHLGIRGGWSPANLNWDGEVRAEGADISTAPPEGISRGADDPGELAQRAGQWFDDHVRSWKPPRA